MAFTQFKLDIATEQSRGIFNQYVYETTDTIVETQAVGYFVQSRFSDLDPDWFGSFITCKCSDGSYTGEITSGGTVTPNPPASDPSFTTLTEGQVPKSDSLGKLIYAGATVDPTTEEWTFDKAINLPAGSAKFGPVVTASEAAKQLAISNNVDGTHGYAMTTEFDETGSLASRNLDLKTQFFNELQGIDTSVITTNPLSFVIIGGVTAPKVRQTNQVTFRADAPMANVVAEIIDNATGIVIRHIPSEAAFNAVTPAEKVANPGLSFIAGDNVVDFVSVADDTPGIFNIGLSTFQLEQGQQLDVEIKADSMSLKGTATDIPFLTQLIQEGVPVDTLVNDGEKFLLDVNYITQNVDQTSTTAETVGSTHVYQATSTGATVTAKQFTAGNGTPPLIGIDTLSVFSPNDIIFVDTLRTKGLYEVDVQLGFVIFARGIGGTANVEDFTRDQVVTAVETGTVTKVNVSVWRTSLTGTPEHGEGSVTPITFHQLAHASDVPIVATEEFANTNNRFFGELGLPAGQQTWVDIATGSATIDLATEDVFGTSKQVVRHNDDVADGSTTSQISLTAQNWIDINDFGASFSGVHRLDSVDGSSGFFSGLQADAAENPLATGNRRYGVIFDNNSGNLRLIEADNTGNNVTMNGTGGNPLVTFDKYFSRQVNVPAGLGAAQVFINGVLTTFIPTFFTNGGGLGTRVLISSGSTGGSNRVTYHDNFGVTIYEESSTKTLSVSTMQANIAQIFVPEGKRDYTVILPDGNPRGLGDKLDLFLKNVGGKLTLRTENLAAPQSIFNGLRELEKEIISVSEICLTNNIEASNIYIEGSEVLNQDPLGSTPGSTNYDPEKGTMNVRNIFPGSSIQVGQESVVFVVNNSGATIPDGKVVNVSGYDGTNDAMEIILALADTVENTEVLGLTTTTMVNGAVGLVTVFGRVNDLDTTGFSAGELVYLSDTSAGDLTSTRPAIPIQMGHIGKIDASIGFIQVEIRALEKSIFGGFSHSLDQSFTANVSAPIQFNKNEQFSGIEHSETVNNDEFTFTSGGVYQSTAEPQYTRTTGGGTDVLNMFLAIDTGSGFVNVPGTNVKFTVNTAGATTVSPLTSTFRVNSGDKIRFMIQVEDANLILDAFPASGTAPNDIPLTPSIIMNIVRIGD